MYARRALVLGLLVLSACGGGGGTGGNGGGGNGAGGGSLGTYTAGVFQPASNYAQHCAVPRSGTSDVTGTATDENNWLRSWTNDTYLWYREVPDLNPSLYSTPDYFTQLKTPATTASGKPKDQFHFTYKTTDWIALSQSGQEVSYGVQWAFIANTPPRRAVIAYVEPAAPAATLAANLSRGVEILTVDSVDLINSNTTAGVATLNAGLSPGTSGESHTFGIRELNGTTRTVTLQATTVTTNPVPTVKVLPSNTGPVGYILFNDHLATSESGLFNAITTLKAQAVTDLVLDIRYNGGGYLDIAAELAYMIAGPTLTAGRTFELTQFNDKYPNTNPISGGGITPVPFYSRSQGFSSGLLASGVQLPTLNLQKVYVLTSSGTCSASEAIINGLRGVDVQVIQIGATTCGKPYGFYAPDNCGTTYFSIQFRGVNNKGFGDYADGFGPTANPTLPNQLPGCAADDDFTHALGDTGENRLEAALGYRATGQCVALAFSPQALGQRPLSSVDAVVVPKSFWRTNRILRQ
ncbi:MAG: S41 family peptidase [Gammaproteobacteria bacterium]